MKTITLLALFGLVSADVTKLSDELADGDAADDKEIEDEDDPEDAIVEDRGFRAGVNWRAVQLSDNDRESDLIANADAADDKEIEDEDDPADAIVEDRGFRTRANWVQLEENKHGDEVANGDKKDNLGFDNKDTVDDEGFRYRTSWARAQVGHKHKKHHGRKHVPKQANSVAQYSFDKYSDGIANGDATDDKQLEFEHDPKSTVVDYNGHTNRGYGAMDPYKWREINKPRSFLGK